MGAEAAGAQDWHGSASEFELEEEEVDLDAAVDHVDCLLEGARWMEQGTV